MITNIIINDYFNSKLNAWSPNTLKAEKSRIEHFKDGDNVLLSPEDMWKKAETTLKPYSRRTLFIRASTIAKFAGLKDGYGEFMKLNRNLFKNDYQKKYVPVSYDDAIERISKMREPFRTKAMELIKSGMRYTESLNVSANETVVGKGAKIRRVFRPVKSFAQPNYQTFYKELKAAGLCPHDLRKLAATRAARNGASPADLCKLMGWSSIATAYNYLQPETEDKLMELLK